MVYETILVIGQNEELEALEHNSQNIIIPYSNHMELEKYPTKKPVTWYTQDGRDYEMSNYNYLLNTWDGLTFDYPSNLEYIKKLLYSLAFYQEQHDIKYMTDDETMKVYKRIYKKSKSML